MGSRCEYLCDRALDLRVPGGAGSVWVCSLLHVL